MYDQIIATYKETESVQQTAILLGVSRNTVQRVLLTEGIWESERSRAVAELLAKGCSAQKIADQLYLSLKCVQNYMPYSKGMNNGIMTENAKKSREKRDRMKKALENQVGNKIEQNIPENGRESVMSKELLLNLNAIDLTLCDFTYTQLGHKDLPLLMNNVSIGRESFFIDGHLDTINDFSFHPKYDYLATVSRDGQIKYGIYFAKSALNQ